MTMDAIFVESGLKSRHSLREMFSRAWLALRARSVKRRTRHTLVEMTDEQLHDIGVTRGEARREIEKSFYWD